MGMQVWSALEMNPGRDKPLLWIVERNRIRQPGTTSPCNHNKSLVRARIILPGARRRLLWLCVGSMTAMMMMILLRGKAVLGRPAAKTVVRVPLFFESPAAGGCRGVTSQAEGGGVGSGWRFCHFSPKGPLEGIASRVRATKGNMQATATAFASNLSSRLGDSISCCYTGFSDQAHSYAAALPGWRHLRRFGSHRRAGGAMLRQQQQQQQQQQPKDEQSRRQRGLTSSKQDERDAEGSSYFPFTFYEDAIAVAAGRRRRKEAESGSFTDSSTDEEASSKDNNDFIGSSPLSSEGSRRGQTVQQKIRRRFSSSAGSVVTAWGFVSSSATALLADRRPWKPTVDAIRQFFETTGIDMELSQSFNARLLDHIIILSRVQKILLEDTDRRLLAAASSCPSTAASKQQLTPEQLEEISRYMRYATAVYGDNMIRAAQLEVQLEPSQSSSSRSSSSSSRSNSRGRWSSVWERKRMSDHIGIPQKDIVLEDVSHDGASTHLRHFVAVDHAHRKVVLAIRGTFNLSELVADIAAFSRPFCGGEAHSEMSQMAERVWDVVGDTVLDLMDQNKEYELILTGHSLGAGAACLLNILFHRNNREMIKGRAVRCFAYAAPPCYKPLEFCPQAMRACTNVIHENDFVPFISVDSVRHLLAGIRALNDLELGWRQRMQIITGVTKPDAAMLRAVRRANQQRLPAKAGAPILAIPATTNIWLREKQQPSTQPDDSKTAGGDGHFDAVFCDAGKLARLGLQLDVHMLTHHMPGRYEYALHNLNLEASSH